MLSCVLWCTVHLSSSVCSQHFNTFSPVMSECQVAEVTHSPDTDNHSQVLCTLTEGAPSCWPFFSWSFSFQTHWRVVHKRKCVFLHLFRPWKIPVSLFTVCLQDRRGSDHASYLLIARPQSLGFCFSNLCGNMLGCLFKDSFDPQSFIAGTMICIMIWLKDQLTIVADVAGW